MPPQTLSSNPGLSPVVEHLPARVMTSPFEARLEACTSARSSLQQCTIDTGTLVLKGRQMRLGLRRYTLNFPPDWVSP